MVMLGAEASSDWENETGCIGKRAMAATTAAKARIEMSMIAAVGNLVFLAFGAAVVGAVSAGATWFPQSWQNFESGSSSVPHLRQ
jgi:hypothetical protein